MSARQAFQGLGFALAAALCSYSCKSPEEAFECRSSAECDLTSGVCRDGACVYPDPDGCETGCRSHGQCVKGPCTPEDGGSGSGGSSSGSGGSSSGGSGGSSSGGSNGGNGGNGGSTSGNGGSSSANGGSNSGNGGGIGTGSVPTTSPDGGPGGGELTVVAGTIGGRGGIDGVGPLARFATPACLAFDGTRFLYTGDDQNQTIRRIDTTTGEVTTIAGYPFQAYYQDGKGTEARFVKPECVSYDGTNPADPVLYVSEWDGNRIRRIALKDNTVTLLAGATDNGSGHVDATGEAARFHAPEAMVRKGNFLYVTDAYNHSLRAINLTTRAVTTVIGDIANQESGSADGAIAIARLDEPHSLALDPTGNKLFIGELRGNRVRMLDLATNIVSTVVTDVGGGVTSLAYDAAGSRLIASIIDENRIIAVNVAAKTTAVLAGSGNWGEVDGPPATANFRSPHGVAVGPANTIFVADYDGPTIRKLVANGSGAYQTTTLAGLKNDEGHTDAIGALARFEAPGDMALAPDNHTLYVLDGDSNCAIRTFDTNTRQVGTLAGGANCNSVDGSGGTAEFQRPGTLTLVTPTPGKPPVLLVTEERGLVRKVETANARVTTLNTADEDLPTWRGIAATATHIYVTGEVQKKILRLPVAGGALADYAGTGSEGCDDAVAGAATLGWPAGILWDGATALYFADSSCQKIRKIDLTNNTVMTVAGGNEEEDENPDGVGKKAAFFYPGSLTWDRQRRGFYVQDMHMVRYVDATTFEVKTVLGDKDAAGGVWLAPNAPRLNFPGGMVEGLDGELYLTSERAILRWGAP